MKIIVWDADVDQRQAIITHLGDFAQNTVETNHPEYVLEFLQRDPNQIVIANYEKRTSHVEEVINGILAKNLKVHPYIILLTDETDQIQAAECLGPIPGDYIVKPIKDTELQARVKIADQALKKQQGWQQNLETYASHIIFDPVTGALTEEVIHERALAEISRTQRENSELSLALIAIKDLKGLIETHGIGFKEKALELVGYTLRANVRLYDLVGRWQQDYFLLLLPGAALENGGRVLERVRKALTSIGVALIAQLVKVNIAAGVSTLVPGETKSFYALVDEAEKALAKAIAAEENTIVLWDK